MKKVKNFINKQRMVVNYKRMWPYVRPIWFRALLSVLICIPIGGLDAVIAMSLKPYMDMLTIEKNVSASWYVAIAIVAFTCLQGVLKYFAYYFSTWVGGKITNALKFDLYKKLLTLPTSYFNKNNSGQIISHFSSMADTACSGLLDNFSLFTQRVFSSLALICVLFYNSWQLAFVCVLVLVVAFAPIAKLKKHVTKIMTKSVEVGSDMLITYNETVAGNKTIISYNLEQNQTNKFKNILDQSFRLAIKTVQRTQWISPAMHAISSFGIAFTVGYGSYLIVSGQITIGNFVVFVTALVLLYTPIRSIGTNLTDIQKSFFAIESVFERLNMTPDIKDSSEPKEMPKDIEKISFKNVSFEYNPGARVLKDVSLEILKGQTVAFVGNSGGGKSTLVSLLPRFYDVTSGSIEINGTNIKEISLKSLRDEIAVVFQDNFLFSGTIRENILLGDMSASDEKINEVIKMAYLDDFIASLPDGLDTYIGERGILLSGGQKQRVAIARAFLKNAPIIVLDEATSALDNKSEAIVQKAIDNLMKDRTVLVIAHRLSTIKNADKIVMISGGEVLESGSHDELMSNAKGHYKALYELQFEKEANIH